jgi:hypothetical protein
MNDLSVYEQKVEEQLATVIKRYRRIFSTRGLSLSYQITRFGDFSDDNYTSEIEIAVLKIIDGKIVDYIDHLDVFLVWKGKENVDPVALPNQIEEEFVLILSKFKKDSLELAYCPVCGRDISDLFHEEQGSVCIHCDCCGRIVDKKDSVAEMRSKRDSWLQHPGYWFNPKAKPDNWKIEEQMEHIPQEYW